MAAQSHILLQAINTSQINIRFIMFLYIVHVGFPPVHVSAAFSLLHILFKY